MNATILKRLLGICLLLLPLFANAQVAINQTNADPDASAMLDVQSTEKGMLIPRMSTAQRTTINNPATGLLVFDNNTGGFWFYNGSGWTELDTDTKLTEAEVDAFVANDGYLTSEVDGSTTNELQSLSLNSTALTISGGNTTDLSSLQNSDIPKDDDGDTKIQLEKSTD